MEISFITSTHKGHRPRAILQFLFYTSSTKIDFFGIGQKCFLYKTLQICSVGCRKRSAPFNQVSNIGSSRHGKALQFLLTQPARVLCKTVGGPPPRLYATEEQPHPLPPPRLIQEMKTPSIKTGRARVVRCLSRSSLICFCSPFLHRIFSA